MLFTKWCMCFRSCSLEERAVPPCIWLVRCVAGLSEGQQQYVYMSTTSHINSVSFKVLLILIFLWGLKSLHFMLHAHIFTVLILNFVCFFLSAWPLLFAQGRLILMLPSFWTGRVITHQIIQYRLFQFSADKYLVLLHRLSDYLFTLARYAATKEGEAESIYRRPTWHRCMLRTRKIP